MQTELLLKQITAISEKYQLLYQKTGGYFNIFEIAGIKSNEVIICRVLRELLDPKGSHFQGSAYLKLFLKYVLDLDPDEHGIDCSSLSVISEYLIVEDTRFDAESKLIDAEGKRIDLVIMGEDLFIPIEVKINAKDQNNQCKDYYKKARNGKSVPKLYYLTLDSRSPLEISAGNMLQVCNGDHVDYDSVGADGIVCLISFENEILTWLYKCLEHHETVKIAPIREILLQLIGIIRSLTNQLEANMDEDIVKVLTSSKENMRSALAIEQSLEASKKTMINKVFEVLEKRMDALLASDTIIGEKLASKKLPNPYDYADEDKKLVKTFYDRKASSHPGISYACKVPSDIGDELWFRIEIDYHIFAGFVKPITDPACSYDYYEYLPGNDVHHTPDFKEFNEAYFNLFDETGFNQFIDQSIARIKNILTGGPQLLSTIT